MGDIENQESESSMYLVPDLNPTPKQNQYLWLPELCYTNHAFDAGAVAGADLICVI